MEINGFYPLYDTARAAAQAEGGDGFSHVGLVHRGKTYYMPGLYRGAKAGEIKLYHGTFGKYDPDMPQILKDIEGIDPNKLKRIIKRGYIYLEWNDDKSGSLILSDDSRLRDIVIPLTQSDAKVLEKTGELSPEKTFQYAMSYSEEIGKFYGNWEPPVEREEEEWSPRRPLAQITQAESESPTRQAQISVNRAMRGGLVDRRFGSMQYRAGGYNKYGGMQTPTDRPVSVNQLRRDDIPVSRTQGTISSLQRGDDCGYLAFYHFIINRGLFEKIQDKDAFNKIGQTDVCKEAAPTPTEMLSEYIPNWSSQFQLMAVGPTKATTRKVDPSVTSWSEIYAHSFKSLEQLKRAAKGKPGLVYAAYSPGNSHLMALINDIKGNLRLIDSNEAQLGEVDKIKPFNELLLLQLDGPEFDSLKARKQKVELKYIMQGEHQLVQAIRDWEVQNAQDAADVVYLIEIMRKHVKEAKFPPFVKNIAIFIDDVNGDKKMQTIYNGFLDLNKLLKTSDSEFQERLIDLKKDFLDEIETMFQKESDKVSVKTINEVLRDLKEDFEREAKRAKLSTDDEEGGPSAL